MSGQDTNPLTADTIVDFVGDIFARRGAESYLGERVTMSQHMLQAAQLAEEAGAPEPVIVSALLHDIGHYTNEFPEDALQKGTDNLHEEAGARVLAPFFPAEVIDPIRHHVAAKRYLCATDPDYFGKLSKASVHTLNLQGGPMNTEEVSAFAAEPNLDAILQVRIWDDQGKDPAIITPSFDHYAPMIARVVAAHRNKTS
ncbi:MAG: HD domain-containing protein [Sulfitobacter sp.]|nr:HD domain-containing protein [Sulfitobacter sp.]